MKYKVRKPIILNKDKRSVLLSMLIGDGHLSLTNLSNKRFSGSLTIKHGEVQKDYLQWKSEIISKTIEGPVNICSCILTVKSLNKSYQQYRIQVVRKKFGAWRKFLYKGSHKSIPNILKFIRHPAFCLAVWFMDDGNSHLSKNRSGSYTFTHLNLHICDQFSDEVDEIVKWIKDNFDVDCKIKWTEIKWKGVKKPYPSLYFNVQQSLKLYKIIRPFIIQVPSMLHKFRGIEKRYNNTDLPQP